MEGSDFGAGAAPRMGQQFCTYCGTKLTPGTKFCTNCGAPVKEAEEAGLTGDPAAQEVYEQGVYEPQDTSEPQGTYDSQDTYGTQTAEETSGAQESQSSWSSQSAGQQYNTGAYAGHGADYSSKGSGKISVYVAAVLCYLFTFVGWIAAYFLGDRSNRYLRFHLNQALVLMLARVILNFILPEDFVVFGQIITFVFWCFGIFHAFRHEEKEIPLIGRIRLIR